MMSPACIGVLASGGGKATPLFCPNFVDLSLRAGQGAATFTRASTGTVFDANWALKSMSTNVHRLQGGIWSGSAWSAPGVTSTSKLGVTWFDQNGFGLLLEPTRTNYIYASTQDQGGNNPQNVNLETFANIGTGIDGGACLRLGKPQGWGWYSARWSGVNGVFPAGTPAAAQAIYKIIAGDNPHFSYMQVLGGASSSQFYHDPYSKTCHVTGDASIDADVTELGTTGFIRATECHIPSGEDYAYLEHLIDGGATHWTFNSGGTGATTIDSAHVQVEAGHGVSTPIVTGISAVTRASEALRWPATGNVNGASGVLIVELELPFLKDTSLLSSGAMGLVSLTGSAASLCYYDFAAQAFKATDGSNSASIAAVPARGKRFRVAVRWDVATNQLQIGCKNITDPGAWSWGTVTSFAGSFAGSDGYITLGVGIPESILIANAMILGSVQSTVAIQGDFS
ncbi:MAG: hypothetical protein HQL66_00755 [Magnetococcales bacterium]|nr:hypothetical protein [Magnetococcales bacterium]